MALGGGFSRMEGTLGNGLNCSTVNHVSRACKIQETLGTTAWSIDLEYRIER